MLDINSSVSPTHGEQEMSVWNGHYGCSAIIRCSCSTNSAILERCTLRPGTLRTAPATQGDPSDLQKAASGSILILTEASIWRILDKIHFWWVLWASSVNYSRNAPTQTRSAFGN